MVSLLDWRRRWRARRPAAGPLGRYEQIPLPRPAADYRQQEFVAVDFETTGLDSRSDLILSVGHVLIRGLAVDLATACHRVVRIDRPIPESSAVIHQIMDDQSAAGGELDEALAQLLGRLAGRTMIAHHASVERDFLAAACRVCWGRGPLLRVIDTQVLARRTLERRNVPFRPADLRLYALAERFNLPRRGLHDALGDALTTAELFLAQAAYHSDMQPTPLKAFLC